MKKCLLALSLLCAGYSIGQNNKIDSLKQLLKSSRNDSMRFQLLMKIGEGFNNRNNDSALVYLQKGLALASQRNDLARKGEALNKIGISYRLLGQPDEAAVYHLKAIAIGDQLIMSKDTAQQRAGYTIKAGNHSNLGIVYQGTDDFKKAIDHYEKALAINIKSGNRSWQGKNLGNMAIIYHSEGNYNRALDHYLKALTIAESMKETRSQISILGNLGQLYAALNEKQKARINFSKALRLAVQTGERYSEGISLGQLGSLDRDEGRFESALINLKRAIVIAKELNSKPLESNGLNNLGGVYLAQGDSALKAGFKTAARQLYDSAIACYSEDLELCTETGSLYSKASDLYNLGEIYFKMEQYSLSEKMLSQSLELASEIHTPDLISLNHQRLSELYERINKPALALHHYKKYEAVNDSLFNEENTKTQAMLEARHTYEKKAVVDSVRVSEEKKVIHAQLQQEKTQRFALYGGLALALLFAGFIFNRFRVTQKQKKIIEAKEHETQQQNLIINHQKHLVEEKHKEITDSINYAERIQRSFLATEEMLNARLNAGSNGTSSYFVFFRPKDVVSGDFYCCADIVSPEGRTYFGLVTADSTGHGVPGAIMSLLNITSLEKAFEHFSDPGEILNASRRNIIERLKKDGSPDGGKDGMDCSLLCFDFENMNVKIAASNNPVLIVRSHSQENAGVPGESTRELIEIKPDKMPVGKHDKDSLPFTTHHFSLQRGDVIYTLTDGFPDQFGGANGKKFMSKKLKELLIANSHLEMKEQKRILVETFDSWKGPLEQVDDVTLIGIRV